jgi:hypothetical protein
MKQLCHVCNLKLAQPLFLEVQVRVIYFSINIFYCSCSLNTNKLHGAVDTALCWSRNPTRCTTVFTRAGHQLLPLARSIQSALPTKFTWHLWIVFFHFHLSLPGGLFPSGFPAKMLYAFLTPMCTTSLAYLIPLDLITVIISGEQCRLQSSSLSSCHFFPLRSKYSPKHTVLKCPLQHHKSKDRAWGCGLDSTGSG